MEQGEFKVRYTLRDNDRKKERVNIHKSCCAINNPAPLVSDVNPAVTNFAEAFKNINKNGTKENLSGEPLPGNMAESHVQGCMGYKGMRIASHNNKGYSKGMYMLLRSGAWKEVESHDADYNHPGGMQRIGDYLLAAVETSGHDKSIIRMYELKDTYATLTLPLSSSFILKRSGGAAAVGIIKYKDVSDSKERFLLCVYSGTHCDFYAAPADRPLPQIIFDPEKIYVYSLSGKPGYAAIGLVAEKAEKEGHNLYLIGLRSEGGDTPKDDYAEAHKVVVSYDDKDTAKITNVRMETSEKGKRHMVCDMGSLIGPSGIHFRWGAGVGVVSENEINLFASQKNFTSHELDINIFYRN